MSLLPSTTTPLATITLRVATSSIRPLCLGAAHHLAHKGLTSSICIRSRNFSASTRKPVSVSATTFQQSSIRAQHNVSLPPNVQKNVISQEKVEELAFKEETFPHPVYTQEQMNSIRIAHRECKNWSDWVALAAVRTLRWTFDKATGYKHDAAISTGEKSVKTKTPMFEMTYDRWLIRFIFLESVAGVFGMVGGAVRHLHSLRRLKRDKGWIETLLDEAFNERMHLLTFLKLRQPGLLMRLFILGAQGVVYNGFFLAYLISPRTCHRFVGYLEEEAVITYTRAINDIENGKLADWRTLAAPEIAQKYWKMDGKGTMLDLLYYIRADEAKHREVNHTLANLKQEADPNPFKSVEGPPPVDVKELPSKGFDVYKEIGWERHDALRMHKGKVYSA